MPAVPFTAGQSPAAPEWISHERITQNPAARPVHHPGRLPVRRSDEAPQSTQLSITTPAQTGLEYAQLLAGNGPWAHAERVQLDKQGLRLLDKAGNTLAQHSGRFEGLDHRLDRRGLLLATVERKRQQAMLIGLDDNRPEPAAVSAAHRVCHRGLCLYRDSARNDFVFLLGEEGVGEQWLVGSQGRLLGEARRVRGSACRRRAPLPDR